MRVGDHLVLKEGRLLQTVETKEKALNFARHVHEGHVHVAAVIAEVRPERGSLRAAAADLIEALDALRVGGTPLASLDVKLNDAQRRVRAALEDAE